MAILASTPHDGPIGLRPPIDPPHCANCHTELTAAWVPDPMFPDQRVCSPCEALLLDQMRRDEERRDAARKRLNEEYASYLRTFLDNVGVPQGRTRACTLKGVPPAILECLPDTILPAMRGGSIASLKGVGYGLIGDTGTGKTALNAVLVKGYHRAWFERWVEAEPLSGEPSQKEVIRWISWPDAADDLSRMATNPESVDSFLVRARGASLLILDDLGRERFAARHDEGSTPFHTGILERIIDARNEMQRPIFWTSNVPMKDLVGLYGSALMSRLVQGNPHVKLPAGLLNLRLQ